MTQNEATNGSAGGTSDAAWETRLGALEQRLGVQFHDRAPLRRALTHHSAVPDTPQRDSYDTLEFLGDALIGARVVEYLFHTYPDATEGELTALKSEVVSRRVLARIGLRLGLDAFVRVDIASLRTFNERSRESLCADVLEALVAAIHLDQGRDAAEAFISREILPVIPEVRATLGEQNPKGALQQHLLRQMSIIPRYELLAEGGAANDRRYTVGVYAGEQLLATGSGASIKEAGRDAARNALAGDIPAE
ncbi:MAG: Ribonuclease III [Ktedonobacterales bacterium]|jgi:ribonuclease-3|nr:MAG: Ribonuclease III [Ktedonobacterales bacterium]